LSEDSPFLSKALAFYQAFAEQNRDAADAQWEIGKAYWRAGEIMKLLTKNNTGEWSHEQAEQAHLTAVKIWQALGDNLPTDAETRKAVALACNNRAHTCYGLREYEKAFRYFSSSTQLDPETAWLHSDRAWALVVCPDPKLRNPQQAVRSAMKALELEPDHAGIWNTLGVAQYLAGQWEAAIESLHKSDSLEEYKGSAFNGFFLAMAYWQIGNRDEARTWYDKSVTWMDQNMPDNEELLRFRAEAAELLGIAETLREAKEETNETRTED